VLMGDSAALMVHKLEAALCSDWLKGGVRCGVSEA
jgi:hypothetical protein